jgi:nucleotide-binding universal stress UspA family protein
MGFITCRPSCARTIDKEAEKAALEKAADLQGQFQDFCEQYSIPLCEGPSKQAGATAGWQQEFGHVDEVLVRNGRLSDVIVVPRPRVKTSTVRRSPIGRAIETLLLDTGRPVLIEPPKCRANRCDRVAIGWNESVEVSRALAAMLPWLVKMSAVTIIVSKKRKQGVKALVNYLAWHGIQATVEFLDGRGSSVGKAILNVCSDTGTELLIVGGFSHYRARELLFGGVTRHLLTCSKIVTIMVH